MSPPPSAKGARRRDPEPSEPLGSGPRVKTCSSSCLSWLHPLRSWSLRQTRGGSIAEGTSTRELLNKNMADNHDRVIPLDDALLLTMVGEKAELVEKGLGISKQFEEMQAQLERLHMDLTAVTADVTTKKLAILKRVEELAKDKLTEFESIPPAETVLFGDRLPRKHVALRLALRSVDAGRGSGRG